MSTRNKSITERDVAHFKAFFDQFCDPYSSVHQLLPHELNMQLWQDIIGRMPDVCAANSRPSPPTPAHIANLKAAWEIYKHATRARVRADYAKNRERIRLSRKKWSAKNADKIKEGARRRRQTANLSQAIAFTKHITTTTHDQSNDTTSNQVNG